MKILGFFKKIWTFLTGGKAQAIFQQIDNMIGVALPIVQEIAALTPTRTDDELIALFAKYRLKVEGYLNLPPDRFGEALLYAATAQLQKRWPNVPWNQLQSAAQLAVSVMKAQ